MRDRALALVLVLGIGWSVVRSGARVATQVGAIVARDPLALLADPGARARRTLGPYAAAYALVRERCPPDALLLVHTGGVPRHVDAASLLRNVLFPMRVLAIDVLDGPRAPGPGLPDRVYLLDLVARGAPGPGLAPVAVAGPHPLYRVEGPATGPGDDR